MKFAESVAEKEGFDTIRLDAFSENPGAVALYERLGYRRAGTVNFRKGAFFCLEKQVTRIRHDGSPKQAIEAVGDSGSPQPQG
jgi:RimJ/RimL family protein N-acetyltransferase